MKTHHKYIIGILLILAAGGAYYSQKKEPAPVPQAAEPAPVQQPEQNPTTSACDSHLWNFVYHPNRLPTKDDCRTVSGTVMWDKQEPDGDYHIRLQLDDPNSAPVNSKNIGGYLVVEPICQATPTQADAIQPCSTYDGPKFDLPKVGSHLTISGFYTIDSQHGWEEIHGVNKLEIQ